MIFLFNRVYLQHDNRPNCCNGQQRMFITNRVYNIPFAKDPEMMQAARIIGNYKDLSEAEQDYGDRNGLWAGLRASEEKILVVANRKIIAELLIQYWRAIFKNPTVDSLFMLYNLFVNSENGHAGCESQYSTNVELLGCRDRFVEPLERKEFNAIYRDTKPVDTLENLDKDAIPFEYLFINYFAGVHTPYVKELLFKKMDMILRENIAGELCTLKTELFQETNNFYLLNGDRKEELITNPIEVMRKDPRLSWALDDVFEFGNEKAILEKYTIKQLRDFMVDHVTLVKWRLNELELIDHVVEGDYDSVINIDVQRHKSNFFATNTFQKKLNGLLICYAYQLKRLNLLDRLKVYELK